MCLRACGWRGARREGKLCAFAWQAERDEGGRNFRRRIERVARNFEDEFGTRVKLRNDGKIAVVARARLGGKAKSDFGLNDDVDFVDEASEGEEVMKNGRRDVVRKIAVDAHAAAARDGSDVGFENVAGNDVEIRELLCEVAQTRQERRIKFDGVDRSAGGEKVLGHFTVPRTNFDPAGLIVPGKRGLTSTVASEWRQRMRRNANGAQDFFAPVKIGEEMLAEALASHGWNSVARGAQNAERGNEVIPPPPGLFFISVYSERR